MIRKATRNDAPEIAKYLFLAMEEIIYQFIGIRNAEQAKAFLLHFTVQDNNQYSYQNCYVVEDNGKILAAANVYNGANLYALRQPVLDLIRGSYDATFQPDDETAAGEYYIDCIAVDPEQCGKGIGTSMLHFLINKFVLQQGGNLGLLVDEDNPRAKKLYLRLGFVSRGRRRLFGKYMEHLQVSSMGNYQ